MTNKSRHLLALALLLLPASLRPADDKIAGSLRNLADGFPPAKAGAVLADLTVMPGKLADAEAAVGNLPGVSILGAYECPGYGVISVEADPSQLNPLASIPQVSAVLPVIAFTGQLGGGEGSVVSEAVDALHAGRLRDFFPGATGQGLRIGVISDSANLLDGIPGGPAGIAESQETGDLPGGGRVVVLMDLPGAAEVEPKDEGRAMMELVHDLAPGTDQLIFATGVAGEATFALNIQRLADAGCRIIVDDVRSGMSPIYQPGLISHSVRRFVEERGGIYLCSAGNYARNAYERVFTDANFDTLHEFEDDRSELAADIADDATLSVELQWAEAIGSVNRDYLLELIDRDSRQVLATTAEFNNLIIQRPLDYLSWHNTRGRDVSAALRIRLVGGTPLSPPLVRLTGLKHKGAVVIHFPAQYRAPTISPHGSEPAAMAIAAAPADDPGTPEGFTSHGPARWLFTAGGLPDPQPETVAKPDFLSVDACSTTFFGSRATPESAPRFFGTSAAAPNAAAVAALAFNVLEGHVATPDANDVRAAFLAASPRRLSHDTVVGHGLVTALAAGFAARQPSPPTASLYPAPSGVASGEFLLPSDGSIASFRVRFAGGGDVQSRWEEAGGIFRPLVALHDAQTGAALSVDMEPDASAMEVGHGSVGSLGLVWNVATVNRRQEGARFRTEIQGPPAVPVDLDFAGGNSVVTNGVVDALQPIRAYRLVVPPGNGGRLDVRLLPAGFRGRLLLYGDADTLVASAATNAGIPVVSSWGFGVPGDEVFAQVVADNYAGQGSFTIEFEWFPDPVTGIPPALGSIIAVADHVVRPNPVTGFDSAGPGLIPGQPFHVLWNPNSFEGACSVFTGVTGETVAAGLYSYSNWRRFLAAGPAAEVTLDPLPPAGLAVGTAIFQRIAAVSDVAPAGVDAIVVWTDPPVPVELPFDGQLSGTLMSHEVQGAILDYGQNDYVAYTVPESLGAPTTITLAPSGTFDAGMDVFSQAGALLASVNSAGAGGSESVQVTGTSEDVFVVLARGGLNSGGVRSTNQKGEYVLRFETPSTGLPFQMNLAADARVSIARPAPGSGIAYAATVLQPGQTLLTAFVPATTSVQMGAGAPGADGNLYGGIYGAARTRLHNPPTPSPFLDFPVTVTAGQQHLQQIVALEDLDPGEPGFEVERLLVTPQFVETLTPQVDGTTWAYTGEGSLLRVGNNRYYRFTMPPTGAARVSISVVPTGGLDVGFTVWDSLDAPRRTVDLYGANAQELLANEALGTLGGTFVLHVHTGKEEGALNDPSLVGRFQFVILAASAGDVPPLGTGPDRWIVH